MFTISKDHLAGLAANLAPHLARYLRPGIRAALQELVEPHAGRSGVDEDEPDDEDLEAEAKARGEAKAKAKVLGIIEAAAEAAVMEEAHARARGEARDRRKASVLGDEDDYLGDVWNRMPHSLPAGRLVSSGRPEGSRTNRKRRDCTTRRKHINPIKRCDECSERTVWRMTDMGKLPPTIMVGALRKWRADQIDQWIENGGKWPARR